MNDFVSAAPTGNVTDLTVVRLTATRVKVDWSLPPCDARGGAMLRYDVRLAKSSLVVKTVSVYNDFAELTGLMPFSDYSLGVRYVNRVAAGPFSKPVSFKTKQSGVWPCYMGLFVGGGGGGGVIWGGFFLFVCFVVGSFFLFFGFCFSCCYGCYLLFCFVVCLFLLFCFRYLFFWGVFCCCWVFIVISCIVCCFWGCFFFFFFFFLGGGCFS